MTQYTVSIFMLTYNQESFIAQTIESIVNQKTNFDYQLVIGEDCSTDTTREICEKYVELYSSKIKLLPSLKNNIGLIANYMRTIKECDGKYIAICDGDDYWIDEYKLQKQVDFLENNPDFSIVGTNLYKLYPDGRLVESQKDGLKFNYEFSDLIFNNVVPSVTALFKNVPKEEPLPNWILNFPYGDWPTYLWVIKNNGKIHILKDFTAVYRMEIGISAKIRKSIAAIIKINLDILKNVLADSNFKNKKEIIIKSIYATEISLLAGYNREKKYLKGLRLFIKMIIRKENKWKTGKFYTFSLFKSLIQNLNIL